MPTRVDCFGILRGLKPMHFHGLYLMQGRKPTEADIQRVVDAFREGKLLLPPLLPLCSAISLGPAAILCACCSLSSAVADYAVLIWLRICIRLFVTAAVHFAL